MEGQELPSKGKEQTQTHGQTSTLWNLSGDTATGGPKVQESMASHAMETNALLRQESYFLDQFKVQSIEVSAESNWRDLEGQTVLSAQLDTLYQVQIIIYKWVCFLWLVRKFLSYGSEE